MAYSNAALAVQPAPGRPFAVIQGGAQPLAFNMLWFEEYIDYIDRKESTMKGYITCLRKFIKWMIQCNIRQPQREDIKEYRDYLTTSGLATGTQAQYLHYKNG